MKTQELPCHAGGEKGNPWLPLPPAPSCRVRQTTASQIYRAIASSPPRLGPKRREPRRSPRLPLGPSPAIAPRALGVRRPSSTADPALGTPNLHLLVRQIQPPSPVPPRATPPMNEATTPAWIRRRRKKSAPPPPSLRAARTSGSRLERRRGEGKGGGREWEVAAAFAHPCHPHGSDN